MTFTYNDGGRNKAGFVGSVKDCTVRAIAIITGRPYGEVYREVVALFPDMPNQGVSVGGYQFVNYMRSQGFRYLDETTIYNKGKFVVIYDGHVSAWVDGVNYDTFACTGALPLAMFVHVGNKNVMYNVWDRYNVLNLNPLNEAQAQTMARLYTLNYKTEVYIKPII